MSSLDYLDLCRLCLVKDRVSVPIFEGEGDVRQIFLKIAACLPVKVEREDKLPKKICDDCVYKVELFYQFWNTTANAEKQLLQWLGDVNLEEKQGYVTNVLNPSVMKQEQNSENRLDGNVMQQVGDHQNNMGMGMMDNMGLGIPMMMSNANQQQITSVPMDTSGNSVQTVQAVPGPSSQTTHNQISQNQTSSTQQEDEEESSEDEENSDEECDGDEGLPVKEESEEDPSNRTIEPTTFVNVSLACDEAGPSGLQQQKISDMPEMPIPQPADGDPKSGKSTETETTVAQNSSTQQLVLICRKVHTPNQGNNGQVKIVPPAIQNINQPPLLRGIEEHCCEDKSVTMLENRNNTVDNLSYSGVTPPNEEAMSYSFQLDESKDNLTNGIHSDPLFIGANNNNNITTNNNNNTQVGMIPQQSVVNTMRTVLVPIIDPVTKEIRNTLVPIDVRNDSGLNLIQNMPVPFYNQGGFVSYAINQLMVPFQQNVVVPTRGRPKNMIDRPAVFQRTVKKDMQTKSRPIEEKYMEQMKNGRKSNKSNEEKDTSQMRDDEKTLIKQTEEIKEEKILIPMQQKEGAKEGELDTSKEEVDKILDNLKNVCPFCQRSFKNESQMMSHMYNRHGRSYKCEKCHKGFLSKQTLQEHQQVHQESSYFQCSICLLKFKRALGLHHHAIRVHGTEEPKYTCDHCGKRFRLKFDVRMHIEKSHMVVYNICKYCGKSVRHVSHHEWEHEKKEKKINFRFNCHLCSHKFTTRIHYENHLQMHKEGFKCDLCGEVFRTPSVLSTHKEVKHKPGRLCTICEKTFQNKSNFYHHVLTHAGLRPYKCDICGKDFTQRSSVMRHRKTHPGPLPPFTEVFKIADIAKNVLQKF